MNEIEGASAPAQDDPKPDPAAVVPWEIRLSFALRLTHLGAGVAAAALLMAGALIFRGLVVASGVSLAPAPADLGFATRAAVVASLTIGYTIGVWRWIAREQYRDLAEATGDRAEPFIHRIPVANLRRSRWAGVLFFALLIEGPTSSRERIRESRG